MHLNQLKKPALEALAEERWAGKETRRLQQVGDRKRKINALKNKLAAWGIDVTYWRYTQFKIDDILFVLHEDSSRYNLVAVKKCEHCKAPIYSFSIDSLLGLGRVLANEHGWLYHTCPPKGKGIVKALQPTTEQRAYNLVKELVGLVTTSTQEV